MKKRKYIDWQYVFGLLALPLIVLGLLMLIYLIQDRLRYNPAYFTQEYKERYKIPSTLNDDLEKAIQQGDSNLMAVLQGTRQVPGNLEPLPKVRFLIFWEKAGKYNNYLFFDFSDYHRYMQHVKEVNGRYVVVPEGLYYYMDSGGWRLFFGPAAAIWWLLVILFTGGVWVYRSMKGVREDLWGGQLKE